MGTFPLVFELWECSFVFVWLFGRQFMAQGSFESDGQLSFVFALLFNDPGKLKMLKIAP